MSRAVPATIDRTAVTAQKSSHPLCIRAYTYRRQRSAFLRGIADLVVDCIIVGITRGSRTWSAPVSRPCVAAVAVTAGANKYSASMDQQSREGRRCLPLIFGSPA